MAQATQNMTPRQVMEQKYKAARMNLLLAMIFTVANIILLFAGSEVMMLFSISVPYYAVIFGVILESQPMLTTGCVIAAVILVVYFLCWLLSKKHIGWMIAALVLLILDTLALICFYLLAGEISGVMDFVFHAWLIYYLAAGIHSAGKLKKLPAEEPLVLTEEPAAPFTFSTPLRRADMEAKHRILLEETYGGHQITYRRVKRVNELVIDGYVYDEYEALMETAHCLSAKIDGHTIEVGFNAVGYSYLRVDGKQIKKKLRLY